MILPGRGLESLGFFLGEEGNELRRVEVERKQLSSHCVSDCEGEIEDLVEVTRSITSPPVITFDCLCRL